MNKSNGISPATDDGFSVIILVGPGERELSRVREVLTSLVHYEPGARNVFIVDDAPAPRDFNEVKHLLPPTCELHIRRGIRAGQGSGIHGGGAANLVDGLHFASEKSIGRYVLKVDADALIIAPFHDRLCAIYDQQPDAGVIGACTITPAGKPRDTPFFDRFFAAASRLIVTHADRGVLGRTRRFPTRVSHLRIYSQVRRAVKAGYRLGENVSGGAYAIRAEAIRKIRSGGLFRHPMTWLHTSITEDALIPMYVRTVGYTLVDSALPNGGVFAVTWRGLPDRVESLVDQQYALIHAVKNDARMTEQEIHHYFALRRASDARVTTPDFA